MKNQNKFLLQESLNVDAEVIKDFGREWHSYDQDSLSQEELLIQFDSYFSIFPWEKVGPRAIGFDAGCGSGRWARLVAPRVGNLYCFDPSSAIEVAKNNLLNHPNVKCEKCSIFDMPIANDSMDFGYSLGVLHHMTHTQLGIEECVKKLKSGAPLLLYIYYAFDNQPKWYRWIWTLSNIIRGVISRLPYVLKFYVCLIIALLIYAPLAFIARIGAYFGIDTHSWLLSTYKNRSFYSMRTDALDRFGTKLEKRFTRQEILRMLETAGLIDIKFSDHAPYWCVVGVKA